MGTVNRKSIYQYRPQNMGVKYFSFIEKFNFDSYTGKFKIRYHL